MLAFKNLFKPSKQTLEQRLSFKVSMFDPGIILHETCAGSVEVLDKLLKLAKFTWDDIDTALANCDVQSAILKVHALKAAFGWFGINNAQTCAERLMIELKSTNTDVMDRETWIELVTYVTAMDLDIAQLKANVSAELRHIDNSKHDALYHVL